MSLDNDIYYTDGPNWNRVILCRFGMVSLTTTNIYDDFNHAEY